MQKAWAKKDAETKGGGPWHSLRAHSADVGATFKCLLKSTLLERRLSEVAGMKLTSVHILRLAVLAALHDAGKAGSGFQKGEAGHLRPILSLFSPSTDGEVYLSPLPLREMTSWFESPRLLRQYLKTAWSHHGEPIPSAPPDNISTWDPTGGYDPKEELARLAGLLEKEWLPRAFEEEAEPIPAVPALENAFAGTLTLADWIGSDRRYFPYENGKDEKMWSRAERRAEKALRRMNMVHEAPRRGLPAIVPPNEDPYSFQSDGAEIEGQVVVAEGPTGTGKTELALGRFARLRKEGKVDGMFFGVPTRAAASELHGRVTEAADEIFEERPTVAQAIPGYVKAGDKEGVRRGLDVYWDGEKSKRNWAAEQSKRYTAAPIAVGTIDQVLLSMLETPHAHMRMAGLMGSLLVVDEVHSLTPYMSKILGKVARAHVESGGHCLFMSATARSSTRSKLLGRPLPDLNEAKEEVPYPYVVSGEDKKKPDVPEKLKKTLRVEVREVSPESLKESLGTTPKEGEMGEEDQGGKRQNEEDLTQKEALARAFASELERGRGRVLGLRNTVSGAIRAHGKLSSPSFRVAGRSVCHHSRYAQPDREDIDEKLLELYGKESESEEDLLEGTPGGKGEGTLTIATQTAEQSLDIDSDWMVTELSPMPVILQRIGRLWRHPGRKRPEGMDHARCIVLAPKADLSSYLGGGPAYGPMGIGTVYKDLRALKATLRVLREKEGEVIKIPRDNRELVERSSHPEVLSRIVENASQREGWKKHEEYVLGERAANQTQARLVGLDWEEEPYSKMSFADADVQSRLGDLPFTVEVEARTPFGNRISEIDIPAWMLSRKEEKDLNPGPGSAEVTRQEDDFFTFDVADRAGGGKKSFVYDRHGFRVGSEPNIENQ
jgi:CRISPR-associated endonuclease/helicase Cas3